MRSNRHGSMFSGNPLAGAAAITALDVLIDEKRAERSRMLGQKLMDRFSVMKSSYFDQVSRKRLFLSLFIYEAHPLGPVTGQRLAALLQKRRVLTNSYRCRIRLAPALVIDEKVVMEGIDMIERALNDLADIEGKIGGE